MKSVIISFLVLGTFAANAVEVCVIKQTQPERGTYSSYDIYAEAECTNGRSMSGSSMRTAGFAKAELIKNLVQNGFQPKSDTIFVKEN